MVVVRNGYIIYQGSEASVKNNTFSVGKSLTSTILGKMIDEGILQLDSPAAEFEPLLSEHYPKVTLRHFATMTSGYNAAGVCRFPGQPENLDWSVTPYDAGTPLFAPGAMYLYWDEAMLMYGRVLTKVLGKSLADYFNEKVGSKIGLERLSWREEGQVDGITINQGCGMITMNALELARFGHLF
ncbi:MAG: beta-lactamase family protein [Phycisphaerales bacterium]|nr:beta-lactamase family protein [Phycisphaerales bacterium]